MKIKKSLLTSTLLITLALTFSKFTIIMGSIAPSDENEIALAYAADKGDLPKAIELLDKGVNINANPKMRTPLQIAVLYGQMPMAQLLLERGANPNITHTAMPPALVDAVMLGKEKRGPMIKLLLQHGANPDIADALGMTALLQAVTYSYPDVVKELIEGGANPDIQVGNKKTPIELAQEDAMSPNRTADALLIAQMLEKYQKTYQEKQK